MLQRPALAVVFLLLGLVLGPLLPARDGYCADLVATPSAGAATGPKRVSVGVWIADISRIDSAAQTFSANVFIVLRWRAPELAHGGPEVKRYALKDIWNPNWLVTNAAGSLDRSFPEIAEVAGDGSVVYRQRLIGSFSQGLDLRRFPFDSANFRIQFAMPGYRPADVEFVPDAMMVAAGMPTGSGIANGLTIQDWRVTQFGARTLAYPLMAGVEIPGYAFEFSAERLSQHYLVKVIVPLLLIVMMSWSVFWIDISLGNAKISVATTSMLTLIAYRFAVGTEVPKLPYLTLLDTFILFSSLLVLITLLQVVLTTRLASVGRVELAQKLVLHARWGFPAAYLLLIFATLM